MNIAVLAGRSRWAPAPDIRARDPSFHRWNGRICLLIAFAASATGLYLAWNHRAVGSVVRNIGTSIDAVLIMVCVVVALHFAIARNIGTHRGWALRLLMVVSGVWLLRAGLMSWILVSMGHVGVDAETLQGPLLDVLALASYLLPLAALEIYLRTKDHLRE
jgi:Predicted membrane protein (DUF2306)